MKTLNELKQLGVKQLQVKNGEAIAINPYERYLQDDEPYDQDPMGSDARLSNPDWCKFNRLTLPPIPAPNIEPGLYEIDRFEPELKKQVYTTANFPDGWVDFDKWNVEGLSFDEAKTKYRNCKYRESLVLKEQVEETNSKICGQGCGCLSNEDCAFAEQVEEKPEVTVNESGIPFINGLHCTFATKEIRGAIEHMAETNNSFPLPGNYTYEVIPSALTGQVAKIIYKPEHVEEKPEGESYDIDFGNHLRCRINIANGIRVEGAMDGWGNPVPANEIVITPQQPEAEPVESPLAVLQGCNLSYALVTDAHTVTVKTAIQAMEEYANLKVKEALAKKS